jgi:hypothetical protein
MIRILFILFSLTLQFSCGVKNDPANPRKNAYPNIVDGYHEKIKNNYYGDPESSSGSR